MALALPNKKEKIPFIFKHSDATNVGIRSNQQVKGEQTIQLPPSSFHNVSATATVSTNWFIYEFADAADQVVHTTIKVPENYDGGKFQIRLYWTAQATTGDVTWRISWNSKAIGEDKDATGHSTGVGFKSAAPTTNDLIVEATQQLNYVTSIVIAPKDIMSLKIERFGTHATDTMTATAKLLHAEMIFRGA